MHNGDVRGGAGARPQWVDAPELPHPKDWVRPATSHAECTPARCMVQGGGAARENRWSPRLAPWLVLVAAAGLLQVPELVADRSQPSMHARPAEEWVIARYEASEGQLLEQSYVRDGHPLATDRAAHEALWREWQELVPAYWARRVEVFEIASDNGSAAQNTFAAYVSQGDATGQRWLLAVDPMDAAERPDHYHLTLVHELAHILTLSDGAVGTGSGPFSSLEQATAACDGPALMYGCLDSSSLLHAYVERFWSAEDRVAADAAQASGDWVGFAAQRFTDVDDRFVSPYATTSPEEDVAETIEAIVRGQRFPSGSVVAAKADFLRGDPELYAVIDRVRARLVE